ncbi:uncharacterized protein LOC125959866 [Anopheles darlingi]|uniref:uncharacterized protein LOC125959866 n=1 Tax=Anopheles darlingi TaxID=43151 RepID=UPI0021002E0B|nr:uncharacterized protein LOC125959866 [Anopheles darlingi]
MERSGSVAMAVTFTGFLVLCCGPVLASPVRSGPSRIVREARPQFVFGGNGVFPSGPGIGVQTPIAGAHLGLTSGLTVNVGRQPAFGQPQQEQPQQQVPVQQAAVVPTATEQSPPSVESSPSVVVPPAKEEGLGTRIDGEAAPATTEILEDHPCYNYDPTAAQDAPADGTTTEHPCAGVGAGNKINPKQAALLSLVG